MRKTPTANGSKGSKKNQSGSSSSTPSTPTTTTTPKRQMSQQSRRKQRSADQLLSRTGHAVPITTPSNRPPPQKRPITPPTPPNPSQSSYQNNNTFGQQQGGSSGNTGGGDDWGFGGNGDWSTQSSTPQQQRAPSQQQQQQQQRAPSQQQQQHSPYGSQQTTPKSTQPHQRLSSQMGDDNDGGQQQPRQQQQHHQKQQNQQPHSKSSQQQQQQPSFFSQNNALHDTKRNPNRVFDALYPAGDDAGDDPSNLMSSMVSADALKNPLLNQNLFTATKFRSKLQGGSLIAPKQQQNQSLVDGDDTVQQIIHKQQQTTTKPIEKATSIFSKNQIKTTIPLDMDPTNQDLDFNPITQLREQFNKDTGADYQDPMDLTRLEAQENKKTLKISKKRDPKRQLITPSDQDEEDTDGTDGSYDDNDHYGDQDAYDTVKTVKSSKKASKNVQELSEDESDPEGYMDLLQERANDDAAFEAELEEYYKKFPQHRKLAHTTRFARNNHINGYGDQEFPQSQFQGEMDDEVQSDTFRQNTLDFDGEMPSDMDDFSTFGKNLRGEFGDVDLTPDYYKNKEAKMKKNLLKKQKEEKKLKKAKLLEANPDLVFSDDDGDSDDVDSDDVSEGGLDYKGENDENKLENDQKKKKFRPLGQDNSFEIDGVRIPLRGLSKTDMEDFMRENQRFEEEERGDEEEEKEHMKALGFTPEELDADRPKRIDYYKLPTPDQVPLIDTNMLQFKDNDKSILNWDVPWPEHTSTCDLSIRTCILGTPNAGKSVIVNNLTRSRVTAVSAKRNTTRRRVLGIATEGNAQMTLYDTPGINEIHDAKKFQRDLATEAWDAVGDADLAVVVIDAAKRIGGPELFLLHKCSDVKTSSPHVRWVLALNKVDLVDPKDKLLDTLYRIQTLMPFDDCFMISGLDGDGVADLEHYLYQQAIPREWEHEREEKTDQSDVQLAAELIRETLYHRLNKEIPYTVQQENVEWMPLKNGQLRIDQRLVVRRDQHKRILVGSNGSALRAITKAAEERLKTAFRRPISLNLRVSVSVTQDFDAV